jgi:hypothetical protein
VTYNSTRKQFFAKLLGVGATTGVLTKLSAKSASSPAARPTVDATRPKPAFEIRHDTRAVARRDVL